MSLRNRVEQRRSLALWQRSLAPLLDVLFLLVIFLLVSANYDAERVLDVELPEAAAGAPRLDSATEQLTITLHEDGTLALNGADLEWAELLQRLSGLPDESRLLPLSISAAKEAPMGVGLALLGDLRTLGFTNASFLVLPPKAIPANRD